MPSENVKICLNGHIIDYETDNGESFCRDCGAILITSCPSCEASLPKWTYYIEYDYNNEPFRCYNTYIRPNFCPFCSKPYPWTAAALEATCSLLEEDTQLSDLEIERLKSVLPDILVETPKTNLACVRIKNTLSSCSRFVADGLKDFLKDFACDVVLHKLGL